MATKTTRRYTIAEPTVFTVGVGDDDDFRPETLEVLAFKLAAWYDSPDSARSYSNSLTEARKHIQQCLLGRTSEGKLWQRAPSTFESRIKAKCAYDMTTDEGIKINRGGRPRKNPVVHHTEEERLVKAQIQENAVLTNGAVGFSSPAKYQDQIEREVISAYPELDTPAHRPNVRRLAMLYAQQEAVNLELQHAKGKQRKDLIDTLSTIQKTVESTMKSLEIYPDQVRKRMDTQRTGSIGELVAALDGDDDFAQRQKIWALTEALQLWWMSEHLNGNKTGPQMHPFEIWHLTRSRPMDYKCACGREVTLVEGFEPHELRDYLIDHGVLVEKPVNPKLVSEEDLEGLSSFKPVTRKQPAPESVSESGETDQ